MFGRFPNATVHPDHAVAMAAQGEQQEDEGDYGLGSLEDDDGDEEDWTAGFYAPPGGWQTEPFGETAEPELTPEPEPESTFELTQTQTKAQSSSQARSKCARLCASTTRCNRPITRCTRRGPNCRARGKDGALDLCRGFGRQYAGAGGLKPGSLHGRDCVAGYGARQSRAGITGTAARCDRRTRAGAPATRKALGRAGNGENQ